MIKQKFLHQSLASEETIVSVVSDGIQAKGDFATFQGILSLKQMQSQDYRSPSDQTVPVKFNLIFKNTFHSH